MSVAHIFVTDAGDYYRLDPSVPQSPRAEHNVPLP